MMKRDEIADPNSCLNRAADDEPLFVLRANDILAMGIVHQWASQYLAMKAEQPEGPTLKQMAKYREAKELASTMWDWYVKIKISGNT